MAITITPSKQQNFKDVLNIGFFVLAVIIGAWLINLFVFQSFSVSGPSMESTLYTSDRLIVNRLPVTWSHIRGSQYIPPRGQVIVFRNPLFEKGMHDEFIVKRVVAFPGERVVVKDGAVRVYNEQNPNGIDFDHDYPGGSSPTAGNVDTIVDDGHIFVMGDHRQEGYSLDSRNGLGTIPYQNIIGPVALRVFPFTKMRTF